AMRELHVVAVPAMTPGELHHAIGDCHDRRPVSGLEIQARVQALVAEDRMTALAVARSDAPRHRREQPFALLADARRLVEAPVVAPAHQLLARLAVAQQPGVEQLAGLYFAGGGALVFDDQVEFVAA